METLSPADIGMENGDWVVMMSLKATTIEKGQMSYIYAHSDMS